MLVFSLFDLQQHLRRVVALNFAEPLWITAEIAQLDVVRGHVYIELVQKGETDIVAQSPAVLWARDHQRLRRSLGPAFEAVLRQGVEVKLRVRVDFHERHGLKLLIEELDPAHTLGQLELLRRQTLQALREQGLLERNRSLPLPLVLQRIAVVSSEGAAGFQDFREQLAGNPFGFRFSCRLFAASVQGVNAAREMQAALGAIEAKAAHYDCVVLLRGGGARLDLAAFDDPALCQAAARCPLPVFTGIGHDSDETVLDLVAHTALKTPTAAADFLVQHALSFENNLLHLAGEIRQASHYQLKINAIELSRQENLVQWSARERLRTATRQLDASAVQLPEATRQLTRRHYLQLEQAEALCTALSPEKALKRGFSITRKNGQVVTQADSVAPGDVLDTQLREGAIRVEVKEKG